jgi:hypothetical protein
MDWSLLPIGERDPLGDAWFGQDDLTGLSPCTGSAPPLAFEEERHDSSTRPHDWARGRLA